MVKEGVINISVPANAMHVPHHSHIHEEIIMAASTREGIAELFAAAVARCRFGLIEGGRVASYVDATMLRALHEAGSLPIDVPIKIDDTDPALVELVRALHEVLADYLDDQGCIGMGLALPFAGYCSAPLEKYVKGLLRSGATLGPEKVVDMLYRWAEGEVFSYWRSYVLNARHAQSDLPKVPVVDGLTLSAMPGSTDELGRMYPAMKWHFFTSYDLFMGHALLSVEYESTVPGIYKPMGDSGPMPVERQVAMPDFDIDRFCEALSLAQNESVRWTARWTEYRGDLREMGQPRNMSYTAARWHNGATVELSEGRLREAITIYRQREDADAHRLDTAIHRWREARDDRVPYSDRLIDLRIALEALYADGSELQFRQSIHGALHLGSDYEERRQYRKLLHKVYGDASKVIHARRNAEPSAGDVADFNASRDLCRRGILKCLAEGGAIDSDRLVLG